MPDEELTLILRLRDEATKQMKSARAGIVAAGAAIAAAGFTAGKKWDTATKTIVAGTGKTGAALKVIQKDYQAVAKYGDGAASAVADLNTVFGETGPTLQEASAAVLKTSNAFGELDVAGLGESMKLFGRDITDVNSTLDTFAHVSQASGAPVGALISQVRTFGPVFKNANISLDETIGFMGAMETAGVDITRVMPAINASLRKAAVGGVTDLRGHLGGLIESIRDTESGTDALKIATKAFGAEGAQRMTAAIRSGALPAMEEWNTMFGDSTDAVEKTHQETSNWRRTLQETKDAALAYIGPAGDMLGVLGSTASGLALAGPQMLKWIKGIKIGTIAQKAFNIVMRLNPIGLIVTAITLVGLAIYKWRDQIFGFLKGAWNTLISGLETGYNFIARLVPGMEEVSFASKMSFEPAVEAAAEVTEDLALEAETASAALSGGGDSLVASLEDTAKAAEDAAEEMRLAKRKFFHDAVIARNKAKVAALKIEQEEAAAVAVVLEARRLQKRQFIHDAVIARNELKVERLRIEQEEADAAAAIAQEGAGNFTKAWQEFGGWKGMMSGASAAVGAFATGGWKAGVMSMVQTAMSFLPPGLAQAAQVALAAVSAVWGKLKSWFGGPDEAELAAREMFAGFHKGAVDAFGDTQRFADEVQVAINAGWDRTLAETRAGFILMGTDMGKTYDEAFADYARYQTAVGEGNTELMEQIEAEYADWRAASEETTEAVVHDAAEIGRQFKGLSADEAAELGDALIGLGSKANQAFTDMHDSAISAGNALANRLLPHILSVSSAIRNMPKDITIRQRYVTVGGLPRRQHGGPVGAGQSVIVGEAGPEIFTPGRSGSVASNKSIPTADDIGAAVVAALHRVPLVVPQDAVTDSILRRSPNRQALRGWA